MRGARRARPGCRRPVTGPVADPRRARPACCARTRPRRPRGAAGRCWCSATSCPAGGPGPRAPVACTRRWPTGWRVECGLRVTVGTLRGVGGSEGDFSAVGLAGRSQVPRRQRGRRRRAGLAGRVRPGGCAGPAAGGRRTAGSAGWPPSAAAADLGPWAADPQGLVASCRRGGVLSTPGFPADLAAWAAELVALDPVAAAAGLGDRPLLVVHGSDDDEVPVARRPGPGRRGRRGPGRAADHPRRRPLAAGRPPGGGHPRRVDGAPALSGCGRAAAVEGASMARAAPGPPPRGRRTR